MKSLISTILFLLLSINVLAIPLSARPISNDRSFKVKRVKRSDYVRHGPTALRKAYRKFGISHTDFSDNELIDFEPFTTQNLAETVSHEASSEDSELTGAVSATSVQGDTEFVSPVIIGGQRITMDFDTGSADLWVMSSQLPSSSTKNHQLYNPANSTTYTEINGTFEISYGDSSYASGSLARDTVSVGGVVVKDQVFGLAKDIAGSFVVDTSSNGLVGLAFTSLNSFKPGPEKTFFDNIAPNLDEPVFTAKLLSDGAGEYEFGKIDSSKYTGSLVNVSVDASDGFWQFEAAQYAVGSETTMHDITDTPNAIADTGTTLMLLSPSVVGAYYKEVTGAVYSNSISAYMFPCSSELPNLSMAVGGEFKAVIPGDYMNYSEIGTNTTTGETLCYGGIQSNLGSDLQVFGDIFLKAFFVVFDQRGPSLGFATHT
ncbi:aspergillopepsin A-like aspartic endopeptidase [Penicillium taxi]|uniref:aspergillopepsin A-like aspartic endopeptidase n=1 Tax=Penicillium taxi TaxID=168475 RepID=UPI0025456D33|nr:aspergillopepsin A-like aspartic endopeptidase [Penicillium taxi]KAJ5894080.1 aspergillopepsin A-like aspartic endopeptidase [Penicillium taxi]